MRRSLIRDWLVVAAALVIGACSASYWQIFARLDLVLFDIAMASWRRAAPSDIVIVEIDEKSLAALGRWPWSRAVHATLLDKLTAANVRAIGLDIILAEQDANNPLADQRLAEAIASQGRVVLPIHADPASAGAREVVPAPPFARAAAAMGHINIDVDVDGLVRRTHLRQVGPDITRSHFALEVLRVADPQFDLRVMRPMAIEPRPDPLTTFVTRAFEERYVIPYAGPPGHFQRVSYVDVLLDHVPAAQLAGRVLFIGATAPGLGDVFSTPATRFGRAMPGVEVSANVLAGVAHRIDISEASALARTLATGMLILVVVLVLPWLSPRGSLFATIGAMMFVVLAAGALLTLRAYWFAPSAAVLAALSAYPAWSWRRLEAAMRFLSAELRAVGPEPATVSLYGTDSQTAASADTWGDFVARRLTAAQIAAEQLRQSRRIFRQSLAGLPVAVLVCDRSGFPILANQRAREYLAWHDERERGQMWSLIARNEVGTRHDWQHFFQQTVDGQAVLAQEVTLPGARHVLVTFAPYALVDDAVVGVIVTLSDISGIKQLEQEREQLLQFISHDLRAPLNSVLALTEPGVGSGITAGGPADGAARDAQIRVYARRALALAEGMLHQARADRIDPATFVELDLVQLLHEVCDESWPLAHQKQQTIERRITVALALVHGDEDLLRRALLNLLTNAIKFSGTGTRIQVELARHAERWSCRIVDQGPGIAAQDLPRVFQPYQRFTRKDRTDPGGLGLGLAFVKTVADKHAGVVLVDSQIDRGSVFALELPAGVDDRLTTAEEDSSAQPGPLRG